MQNLRRFYLRFDTENKGLSKFNGLTLKELSLLLKALDDLTNPGDNSFISITEIKGDSYGIEGVTVSETREQKLIRAHQNLEYRSFDELSPEESKYAYLLTKNLLRESRFIELYDNENRLISKIFGKSIGKEVDSYNVVKSVYGIISEIGSKSLTNKTHIEIDKLGYRIFTTPEQDYALKEFYRDRKLTFKIKQKITLSNDKIASAILLDFTPSSKGSLMENISKLSVSQLSFLENVHSHEDVLKLIRE